MGGGAAGRGGQWLMLNGWGIFRSRMNVENENGKETVIAAEC